MQYGAVVRSKPGNTVSGDTFLYREDPRHTLVALIDGLGAGQDAYAAAQRARACVRQHCDLALTDLLMRCHAALRGTRGAVMMLMRVEHDCGTVSFAGVGNVGVRAFSEAPIAPLSRHGIVGYQLREVRGYSYPYAVGDVFILYSDGIAASFRVDEGWVCDPRTDLQQVAEQIADQYGMDDDLTVVVVR
ncbi:MAG: SpoIIE family protein phosphatase [Anaerolineae bacterium]|nr:SpoIIE family protein phosphatase [Anaerolineae bacterium]